MLHKGHRSLYIQHEQQNLNLSAFDEILSAITGTSNVTATTLLESKPFTLTYENNIILSVQISTFTKSS